MKSPDPSRYALSIFAGAALLAGCGGSQPPIGTRAWVLPSFRAAGPMPLAQARVRARHSWVSPAAKNVKKLLYVAGALSSTIYIYDYETRDLVGELHDSHFEEPMGECVDSKGDVWITNWQGTTVSEYAHSGSAPIATLTARILQTACSVDPTTGNLAVGTFYGTLYVWRKARGTPTTYSSSACPYFWGPGYDDKGNLFMEAGSASEVWVCELPHGGGSLQIVPFNQTIYYGADVMWDGKYITLADQSFGGIELQSGVYQAKLNASGDLTLAGSTKLADPCGNSDVIQPFIVGQKNTPDNTRQGTSETGSNNSCLTNVDLWAYPAGGDPTYTIHAPDKVTQGSAVSIKE